MTSETMVAAPTQSSVIEALQDLRLGVQANAHCLDDGAQKLAALDFAIVAIANLSILVEHAKGLVNHAFNGVCPDPGVGGVHMRDEDCPVCQAITSVENARLELPAPLNSSVPIPPVVREALEAVFEQRPGHLALVSAAVRELGART